MGTQYDEEEGNYLRATKNNSKKSRRSRHHHHPHQNQKHQHLIDDYDYEYDGTGCCSGCGKYCCYSRAAWWGSCGLGFCIVVFILAGVAIGLSIWALVLANYPLTQTVSSISGPIDPSTLSHVFNGAAPQTMTLPNDMTPFIGRIYNFDCQSPFQHVVQILPGPLTTTFDGSSVTATCSGSVGDGFSIKVSSSTSMRVFGSNGMLFA